MTEQNLLDNLTQLLKKDERLISEEESFMHFIKNTIDDLNQKYKEVALLRNERFLTIYDFDEGASI